MRHLYDRKLPVLVLLPMLLALPGVGARAQEGVLPGDERVEPPEFEEPSERPRLGLPPPPPPSPEEQRRPSGQRGFVSRIQVEGSSVFEAEELARVTAPFEGRMLAAEDLYAARDAVTQLYREHGYITSGAILPDQQVQDGLVRLHVVEGRLAEIDVGPTRWFRAHYFRSRLARAGQAPVDVFRLERTLQLLQRDPLVRSVSARLEPTEVRGESRLVLDVVEEVPAGLDLVASNHRSVSLGEYAGDVSAMAANLTGFRDELRFDFGVAEGLRDYAASFAIPVTRYDTLLGFHFRDSEGDVVLDEYDALDIQSFARTWGVSLEQPLLRNERQELRLGLVGEYRESQTELLDAEFCTISEAEDCDPQVAALRFFQQYTASTQRNAFALRSSFSLGIDALGATRNRGSVADGQFLAWLGQLQWVHRLPPRLGESLVVARVDTQLASDPLLPIEKFSVGGARTVRGYRENQLVRDNGVVGSLEVRVPLFQHRPSGLRIDLAPFADVGHAWDRSGPDQQDEDTLASLGAGLRFEVRGWLRGEFYWGGRLLDAERTPTDGLQRHGMHFRVTLDALDLARDAWRRR